MNGKNKNEIVDKVNNTFKCFYQDFEDIDWERISLSNFLNEAILSDLEPFLDWDSIFAYQDKFSEDTLKKYIKNIVEPSAFLVMRDFSFEFLLLLLQNNKITWADIATFSSLTEKQINEHKTEIDWIAVCANQNLSQEFIIENKDYVYINVLIRNNKINEETLNTILNNS